MSTGLFTPALFIILNFEVTKDYFYEKLSKHIMISLLEISIQDCLIFRIRWLIVLGAQVLQRIGLKMFGIYVPELVTRRNKLDLSKKSYIVNKERNGEGHNLEM